MKQLALIGLLALIPVSCGGGDDGPKLDPVAVAAGKTLFTSNGCVGCHGATGIGDGAAAVALPVKPRNYTDAKWQDATPDADIKKVIKDGGKAHGMSEMMAAYPNLSDVELNNIVAFIRSLKK